MSLRIIIPARYGSTRLPGKPLLPVAGIPLLQRVWALGASVVGKDKVIVTTDDQRIADFCAQFGANCIMTDSTIPNGSLRVHAAVSRLDEQVDDVINLQGDAVLTPPWVIQAIIDSMRTTPEIGLFTPAVRMTNADVEILKASKASGEVSGTTVTFDRNNNALYFSKSIIPFVREQQQASPIYRHIGLYGYRFSALTTIVNLPPTPLEQTEKLEQLRALEHGMKVRIVQVDYNGRSHIGVDSENDRQRAEKLIATEGELLPIYDGSFRYMP